MSYPTPKSSSGNSGPTCSDGRAINIDLDGLHWQVVSGVRHGIEKSARSGARHDFGAEESPGSASESCQVLDRLPVWVIVLD